MKWLGASVLELSAALTSGKLTAVELVEECLSRMENADCVGAFARLDRENAMNAAHASDRRRAEGRSLGALDGIPFAAEDRFCVKGQPTENHCAMLGGYRPLFDAEAVKRLQEQGAILLGKLQTDGFLSGRVNERECAASKTVLSGALPFALTAETGGSLLMQGEANCVAFAPAKSECARGGMISCAPSFDRVSVMAKSASDAALLWEILRKRVEGQAARQGISRRVAVLAESFAEESLINKLKENGADLRVTEIEPTDRADRAFRILAATEAASEMALCDGIRFGASVEGARTAREMTEESRGRFFSCEEKELILLGTALLMGDRRSGCYRSAQLLRERVREAFARLLEECDLMACRLTEQTVRLAELADLSAVAQAGVLLIAPAGREALLLKWADRLSGRTEGV